MKRKKLTKNEKKAEIEFVEEITNICERKANTILLATYYYEKYTALCEAGFTPHESLEIIKARGLQV